MLLIGTLLLYWCKFTLSRLALLAKYFISHYIQLNLHRDPRNVTRGVRATCMEATSVIPEGRISPENTVG